MVLLAPELLVIAHVQQLSADRETIATLKDAARQHGAHAQLFPGRHGIGLFPLVAKDRAARDHFQVRKLSQTIDDALGQTI